MTTKKKAAKPPAVTHRPIATGRVAVDANRRRVLAELYESFDARNAIISRIQGDFTTLEDDLFKEDYESARDILQGMLLTVEALDLVREVLERPKGDSSAID